MSLLPAQGSPHPNSGCAPWEAPGDAQLRNRETLDRETPAWPEGTAAITEPASWTTDQRPVVMAHWLRGRTGRSLGRVLSCLRRKQDPCPRQRPPATSLAFLSPWRPVRSRGSLCSWTAPRRGSPRKCLRARPPHPPRVGPACPRGLLPARSAGHRPACSGALWLPRKSWAGRSEETKAALSQCSGGSSSSPAEMKRKKTRFRLGIGPRAACASGGALGRAPRRTIGPVWGTPPAGWRPEGRHEWPLTGRLGPFTRCRLDCDE